MKANAPGGSIWRLHQLADGFEDCRDFVVVFSEAFFEFQEFESQLVLRAEEFAELDEGAHDLDIHENGTLAAQYAGEHGYALLGKGEGCIATPAASRV